MNNEDTTFHFVLQLGDTINFWRADTVDEVVRFYTGAIEMGFKPEMIQCYLSNLKCYIGVELSLVSIGQYPRVLAEAKRYLDWAFSPEP